MNGFRYIHSVLQTEGTFQIENMTSFIVAPVAPLNI